MYNKTVHIHFIGVGGVGMAGIAEVLLNLDYSISGSDIKKSDLTIHLESLGAKIFYDHRPENLPLETSVVVISTAVDQGNVELQSAYKRGIPVIRRAEMLAELMRMKYGIAVAGSHGKTSTTSMTAQLLRGMGLDPTVIVGGRVLSEQTGARLGQGKYLVAEADESDGSFCLLRPAIAIVTNIDLEHLSHYKSLGALEQAFLDFMNAIPFYGLVVVCGDDPILRRLVPQLSRRVVTYGLGPGNDIIAGDVECVGWNCSYDLIVQGVKYGRVKLPIPGRHMIANSLAAIAVAIELGANPEALANCFENYAGVSRRSEKIAEVLLPEHRESKSVIFVDDYGHHPSEIRATLKALHEGVLISHCEKARLIVIFQPHRYSRTKDLFADFLSCFEIADKLFVTDIYSAGEEQIEGITSEVLVDAISFPPSTYVQSFDDLPALLEEFLQPGDVVVTMGAGTVGKFAKTLKEYFSNGDILDNHFAKQVLTDGDRPNVVG